MHPNPNGSLEVSQVNLALDSSGSNPTNSTTPLGSSATAAALARALGYKDNPSASISSAATLDGVLRSVKGTFGVTMSCTTIR